MVCSFVKLFTPHQQPIGFYNLQYEIKLPYFRYCHNGSDLALAGDEQLVAGDEPGDLVPGQRAEVLALDGHLLEVLEDELLGGEVEVPGPHEAGVQVHGHRVAFVDPDTTAQSVICR